MKPFTPTTRVMTRKRIIAYDLEWVPLKLELRLVGVKDLRCYRSYPTVDAFISGELHSGSTGAFFAAHAGGLYDSIFLLKALRQGRYHVAIIPSGSSAILMRVTKGRYHWSFIDSYAILKSPLAKIGLAIGKPKIDCDFDAPMPELIRYNERDCDIVLTALYQLQEELSELGGELRLTVASIAMGLFRSRYMGAEIYRSRMVNESAMFAYHAARVEIYRHELDEPAHYYDINSSFPNSMLHPQPGSLLAVSNNIPGTIDLDTPILAHAIVSVPSSYIGPLPFRVEGMRVFFPTGTWEGWFTQADLISLFDCGGHIVKAIQCMMFHRNLDLGYYVRDMHARKQSSPPDSFKRLLYKYLLNSLYGKFTEREEKTSFIVNPSKEELGSGIELVSPGVYSRDEERDISHRWVPIGANITAISRNALHSRLVQASNGGKLFYTDTDSVLTTATLPSGQEIGELQDQSATAGGVISGTFLCPKVYRLIYGDGSEDIKAKGFPKLDSKAFERLRDGEAIEDRRFTRLRGVLASPSLEPSERAISKALRGLSRPKRQVTDDGDTVPWSVLEVMTDYHNRKR